MNIKRQRWRVWLAATALLATAHPCQAAVETKTLHIDFIHKQPTSQSTWGFTNYYDNGDTPLIQVYPWGGFTSQGCVTTGNATYSYSPFTTNEMVGVEGTNFVFRALWLTGGGFIGSDSWYSDFRPDKGEAEVTNNQAEGRGAGIRICPIVPNSAAQSLRIKKVTGNFWDPGNKKVTYCRQIQASFGSDPTVTVGLDTSNPSAGSRFVWTSPDGRDEQVLGLFFRTECWLASLDVEVEIATGEDITEGDLVADDLFARQWPEHLFFKQYDDPATVNSGNVNGATSVYRVPGQQIIKVDKQPMFDIANDDFTCVTSEGRGILHQFIYSYFNGAYHNFLFGSSYSDGVYGVANMAQIYRTNRVPGFKASITKDAEGKKTRIVYAKIYFTSTMADQQNATANVKDGGTTYKLTDKDIIWNWGKVSTGILAGGVENAGTPEEQQYLLWTGDTDDLEIDFAMRYRNTGASAWTDWIPSGYSRCIRYVELGVKTESSAAAPRPWLTTGNEGTLKQYIIPNTEFLSMAQSGRSLTVNKPDGAAKIYYVKDEGIDLANYSFDSWPAATADGKVVDTATETIDGGTITFDATSLYANVILIATDADGNVLGTCQNRFVSDTHTQVDAATLQGMSYTWKDIDGNEHTNALTDAATDPMQMMSLIKYVYTTPSLPGTIWRDLPDFRYLTKFPVSPNTNWPYWNHLWNDVLLPEGSVHNLNYPTEGVSLLIVEAQDQFDWGDFKNGIYKYGDLNGGTAYSDKWKNPDGNGSVNMNLIRFNEMYKRVRLLQNSQRIEDPDRSPKDPGYNPGTLFYVNGEYDRFFFISKGRVKEGTDESDLRHMYEEIAPVIVEGAEHLANDVYGSLLEGEEPTSEHDCYSVPVRDHWLRMKRNGEAQRLDNMLIYIPDYRFNSTLSTLSYSPGNDNHYTTNRPTLGLYTVQLDAETAPVSDYSEENRMYDIFLDWGTSMQRMNVRAFGEEKGADINADYAIKEEFQIYYQELNTETGYYGEWKKLTVKSGEGGIYHRQYALTYDWPQKQDAQYINYRVYARLENTEAPWVLSNEDVIVIPGWDTSELLLLPMDIAYISDFDVEAQKNYYKNYLTMLDKSRNQLLANYLVDGTKLNVYRIPAKATGGGHDEKQLFCVINIGRTIEVDGVKKIEYTLADKDYYNQDETAGHFDASLRTESTGHFTVADNGMVDFGQGFYMVDQFSASVADNDHAPHYDYMIEFNSYKSNRCRVPVFKSDLSTTIFNFDQDAVNADTNGDTELDNTANMIVNVGGESNLLEYAALRNGVDRVGTAQRGTTGNYTTFKCDSEGRLTVVMDREHIFPNTGSEIQAHLKLQLEDSMAVASSSARWYVINIEALTKNWPPGTAMYKSTYGTHRTHVEQPTVSISQTAGRDLVLGEKVKDGEYKDLQAYLVPLTVVGDRFVDTNGKFESSKPGLYRVWRDGVVINGSTEEYMTPTPESGTWYTGYKNLEEGLWDTDLNSAVERMVNDYFRAAPIDIENGEKKTFTYRVRLYSEADTPAAASGAPRRAAASGAYAISESTMSVTFSKDNNVITAVARIIGEGDVQSVTYTNTLGQVSDRPWQGANIVTTRYADGTVVVTKRLH